MKETRTIAITQFRIPEGVSLRERANRKSGVFLWLLAGIMAGMVLFPMPSQAQGNVEFDEVRGSDQLLFWVRLNRNQPAVEDIHFPSGALTTAPAVHIERRREDGRREWVDVRALLDPWQVTCSWFAPSFPGRWRHPLVSPQGATGR